MSNKKKSFGLRQSSPRIKKILSAVNKKFKKQTHNLFRDFAKSYLESFTSLDIDAFGAEAIVGVVEQHWVFAEELKAKKSSVNVYNPTIKIHGWNGARTIIQIVTDDMPFLVDSVSAELSRQNLEVDIVVHPVMRVQRDKTGRITKLLDKNTLEKRGKLESFMFFQITEQPCSELGNLKNNIEKCIYDVRSAFEDKESMRAAMAKLINELSVQTRGGTKKIHSEVVDFLNFIENNNFIYLGFREYKISGAGRKAIVKLAKKSGLGVLRSPERTVFEDYKNKNNFPPETAEFLARSDLVMVTKTNHRSTVSRSVHMDAIGIKKIDIKGRVVGHRLFIGLFTSGVYSQSPRDIPILRQKVEKIFVKSGFQPNSHDGNSLEHVLGSYPRDELFQASEECLYKTIMGIWHLKKRPRVALFIRKDGFGRYVSCLVFLPRERYTTTFRQRCQEILSRALNGVPAAFFSQLGDSPLARVHLIIKIPDRKIPRINIGIIESEISDVSRMWGDKLSNALISVNGEKIGLQLSRRYSGAFQAGYQTAYSIKDALTDIYKIEKVIESGEIGLNLYQDSKILHKARFKIYHNEGGLSLSDVLPVFEHMGFKVINEAGPHSITPESIDPEGFIIHDFGLETRNGKSVDVKAIRENFHEAFRKTWLGEVESDGFNGLIISSGLSWRQVVILRAYCKYLRQINITFSQAYMEQTLFNNPRLSKMLVELFLETFNPQVQNNRKRANRIREKFLGGLEKVWSADEDRILRLFLNIIEATLRTNYFQMGENGSEKPYLSFKINSQQVEELPLPRPFREIFVYSPRVEGIHLRFGKVARGGLRWSDRPEDFRTEILGLVKAQQVKNAVIVPVGSKGGFVVKRPPHDMGRDAFLEEGISCYKTFISGLLDLTDNIKGSKIVPPKNILRLDEDDPYLVVAADKGTATFSDIANSVSEKYGHWLGDAFASGGSQGYDHKKMGITARGGWESVKRHFREMNLDTQSDMFRVVGVGDMSGDVFGNGMLLSRTIKLVAAFNHLHIFLDPDPDPKTSFLERRRVFKLARSTWTDYDQKKLSKGGAIFDRSAKVLTLSKEIQALVGIEKNKITPTELLKNILKIKVDLMWFGGIGTYIKSAKESDLDVGDRANDSIRIDGNQVRAKVIGEGANLGCTQLGRIEAAEGGVRLNTDAIDNSAGVDSSDHEVNIKILLNEPIQNNRLTYESRNKLLSRMTDEVAQLVLRHNYEQTQAISLVRSRGFGALEKQQRFMNLLERQDKLNRKIEFLPDDEELKERLANKQGLYSPEISVLINYAKNWLYEEVLVSDLPKDPYLLENLVDYFPSPLRKKYKKGIGNHRLSREIISTRLANSSVNRGGDTFVSELMEKTGRNVSAISRAWFIAQEIFSMTVLWNEIEMLDNKVSANHQTDMMKDTNGLIEWTALWFLRKGNVKLDLKTNIDNFRDGILKLSKNLATVLPKHYIADAKKRGENYTRNKVPAGLAHSISHLVNLYAGCDIVQLAKTRRLDVLYTAKIYYAIGSRFRLGRLRAAASSMNSMNHWQARAIEALIEELYGHQLRLTESVLDIAKAGAKSDVAVENWIEKNKIRIEPTEQLLIDLWSGEVNELSMIAVASRQIRSLAESAGF